MLRVLCLGNELLADDAFGPLVARRLQLPGVEVVTSSESGLRLLDHLLDVPRLLIVDTIQTGDAPPGTIRVLRDVPTPPGVSPHGMGPFETLALARALGYQVPAEVTVIAVEAADCLTLGGPMHPAVAEAIPRVIELASETWRAGP